MRVIGVSQKFNNCSKRRRLQDSKCSKFWCLYYEDDYGNLKTKKISRIEAIRYKILLKKPNRSKKIACSECGFVQEDIGQEVCDNCGI